MILYKNAIFRDGTFVQGCQFCPVNWRNHAVTAIGNPRALRKREPSGFLQKRCGHYSSKYGRKNSIYKTKKKNAREGYAVYTVVSLLAVLTSLHSTIDRSTFLKT